MLKLFQKNDLSQVKLDLRRISNNTEISKIESVLRLFLGNDSKILDIFQVKSSHYISNKFSITTPSGKFFLKCQSDKGSPNTFFRETKIADFLKLKGVNVPRIIKLKNGEYGCSLYGRHWILFEFIFGKHFTGIGDELQSASEEFAKLTKVLENYTEQEPKKNNQLFIDDLQTLLDLANQSNTIKNYVSKNLHEHYDFVSNALSKSYNDRNQITKKWSFMHTEFHPMNLLMHDEKVLAILDFEDINWSPILESLGFNAYKLIREMMTNPEVRKHEIISSSLINCWISGWRKSFPKSNWGPEDLGKGARYRVLCIIRLILNNSLKLGNTEYLYDLEKQIYSLYEIEKIFWKK